MRLWSLHPSLLDAKGLVALWREGLLAQKVLLGRTRGYRRHPQLDRFRASGSPVRRMGAYLSEVYRESSRRGYRFNRAKIVHYQIPMPPRMKVARGQLLLEWRHLTAKLRKRAPGWLKAVKDARMRPHPLFRLSSGGVEAWEKSRGRRSR